jgi:hypothetical protein
MKKYYFDGENWLKEVDVKTKLVVKSNLALMTATEIVQMYKHTIEGQFVEQFVVGKMFGYEYEKRKDIRTWVSDKEPI